MQFLKMDENSNLTGNLELEVDCYVLHPFLLVTLVWMSQYWCLKQKMKKKEEKISAGLGHL